MTKTELIRALKSIPALHKGRGYEWTFGLWTIDARYNFLVVGNRHIIVMQAEMSMIDHVRWSNRLEIAWFDGLQRLANIWHEAMTVSYWAEQDDDKWFPQDEEADDDKG